MVDAEPRMDRLVLGTDRGVIVAQFGLVALAAQHVDPAIARDRGEPGQECPPAIPRRELAVHRQERFLPEIVDMIRRDPPRETTFEPFSYICATPRHGTQLTPLRCAIGRAECREKMGI